MRPWIANQLQELFLSHILPKRRDGHKSRHGVLELLTRFELVTYCHPKKSAIFRGPRCINQLQGLFLSHHITKTP